MLLLTISQANAQYSMTAVIKSNEDQKELPGAVISWKEQKKSFVADSTGSVTITEIPAGKQHFIISHVGFEEKELSLFFPLSLSPVEILLELSEEEEEEVIISATRSSRTITNTPTRVEVISGEELAEKGNMKPGDIRMLLNESTGIQTQQTSATSFNAGIRIQGLDGRYTQVLRDGYPLYGGYSGGLSIMQVAPLDLQQVEVIKGSASTLYGGGAIAGLVNLVSRTPGEEAVLNFLGNATTAGGLDLSAFYAERYGKTGLTVFASRNSNAPFDPAGIGLTALPKFERYTINPRLFLYGNKINADIGFGYIHEDRIGGSIDHIKERAGGYFEKNNTARITGQSGITLLLNDASILKLKNSYSRFSRMISIPAYLFDALQQTSFTELTWNLHRPSTDWIAGANLITEDLDEKIFFSSPRDYHYNTYGAFVQNTWSVSEKFTLETGLRADYVKDFGLAILPRISAMLRISPSLTSRLGGGSGYKTPSIFTEESERIQFQGLLPINRSLLNHERSLGANWDINFNRKIGDVGLSINHLFFYTKLNKPLVMVPVTGGGGFEFQNADGYIDTKGTETNLRLIYGDFKLFVGYTYTDAASTFNDEKQRLALTAKHRLNNVLMYEIEEKLKLGLEAYYFSRQALTDGSSGQSYWIMGFMAEKLWERFSLFINFENFTDTRQSKFDSIYTGSIDQPVFRDIYAPVEGFVVNGGIKISVLKTRK